MTSLKYLLLLLFFTIDLIIGIPPTTKEKRSKINTIIKRLIEEVEQSGMQKIALYSIPGDKAEMRKLANECLNPNSNISPYDIHVMTYCLKTMIGNLEPPLIDKGTFDQLSHALEIENSEELKDKMKEILFDLPQEIRYTLAYLMRHLRKVVKLQEINGMTPKMIAKAFRFPLMKIELDGQKQREINFKIEEIIKYLLEIPSSFWKTLINYESTISINKNSESSVENSDEAGESDSLASSKSKEKIPNNLSSNLKKQSKVNTIIKRVIEEVEKSGMQKEGLYSIDSDKAEMRKLANECLNPNSNISPYDIHVMTFCLKAVIGNLEPPLIDEETFNQLSDALKIENSEELKDKMKEILSDLPQEIRYTLAYLMKHLKKVVKLQEINGMTPKIIAKAFRSPLMKFDHVEQGQRKINSKKEEIIMKLLEIPSIFWEKLINYELTNSESNIENSNVQKEGDSLASNKIEEKIPNTLSSYLKHRSKENTIIKRLIEEVEISGMQNRELYSINADEDEMQNLVNECLNPNSNISTYSIYVITYCLKTVIGGMEPSLIDEATYRKLLDATKLKSLKESENKMLKILSQLPQDILNIVAYLIIHLEKVVELHEINEMTEEKIASIFSLILMHYEGEEGLIADTDKEKIIEILLKIPTSYLKALINFESTDTFAHLARNNKFTVHPITKRLIEAVEKFGLRQEGLYYVKANSADVLELARDCLDPNMKILQYGVHVITSYLKSLLRDLRPSLIDKETFLKLQAVMKMKNFQESKNKMSEILFDLPQDTRNTLAYLMIHLQSVVKQYEINTMTDVVIAAVFGPILMHLGYDTMEEMVSDPTKINIVLILLNIPSSYWESLVNYESTINESTNSGEEEGAWGGAPRQESSASNEVPENLLNSNIDEAINRLFNRGISSKSKAFEDSLKANKDDDMERLSTADKSTKKEIKF
ncbi:uncharacterized protein LOC122503303 [Leptopilina heterotoma]|uniref:uncharacterized protein LOC122503303 n=1 Tax=Leptopilina heterotoma TaxID=63436 RepID=UPI001CA87919|nr:uncharacterized protein LOC122503303 [Leptopilina heterotoma]